MERVEMFRAKYANWSEPCVVNGIEVDTIDTYLSKIDFTWLTTETSWKFIHGDLHFDNTIYQRGQYLHSPDVMHLYEHIKIVHCYRLAH
jgi:hypothetical protein